jgi:hypothetical protein
MKLLVLTVLGAVTGTLLSTLPQYWLKSFVVMITVVEEAVTAPLAEIRTYISRVQLLSIDFPVANI